MLEKTIAVLEGDGIGPEIMREGIKVLNAISVKYGHTFHLVYAPFGAQAYFEHGHPFPEDTKKICDEADSILKGPVGLSVTEMNRIPKGFRPENAGLLPLRGMLDAYANFRPVVLPPSFADFSPLKPEVIGAGIDILMLRELVGGSYFGDKIESESVDGRYARDDCTYTREQVERFAHVAFREARARGSKLTSVHKANILATSRFWDDVFREVSGEYPDVTLESMVVDNVAYQLVINPTQFNGVMAMENLQGDILTDQAGGLLGSLGLMPSACFNPETGRGYFEPAHGSAPGIAGKNVANPYSMIGSVALMLDMSFGLKEESSAVWDGLKTVFSVGFRTGELKRHDTPKNMIITTSRFGDLVERYILTTK